MGRNLNQVLAGLPADRRARIDARYRDVKAAIESLRERRVAGKTQTGVASGSRSKQRTSDRVTKRTAKAR